MTYRFTLKLLLLGSVSHGAQDFSAQPWLLAFELEADYALEEIVSAQPRHTLSLLGWIKAWLCLLMGVGGDDLLPAPRAPDAPLNRRFARRRLNKVVSARKMDGLVYHIYRRYGLKRCQQWLYNRKLTGRVHWCFGRVVKRWSMAEGLARQNVMAQLSPQCRAILSPD